MKKILGKRQLISIVSRIIFLLLLVFFTSGNAPAAYGRTGGEITIYNTGGNLGVVFSGDGKRWGRCCGSGSSWNGLCIDHYPGINTVPDNTIDSACAEVYGQGARGGKTISNNVSLGYCGGATSEAIKIECIIPTPTFTPTPVPPGPPCAEWKDGDPKSGVCLKVGTSLFQGGTPSPAGNISTDPSQFIVRIFTIILGFAGGIALLLIISAAYKLLTSKGKPESIQQGKDQLTSAIVGLVFIIFSFLIFQLIFVDVLKIPGITK